MSTHQDHSQLLTQAAALLSPGQELPVQGPQLSHWPITDTALAACLATLDIPFREPEPYTDSVTIDSAGDESAPRRKYWWLLDASRHEDATKRHKTEELVGAWAQWERFKTEHPAHPLIPMRAAIDARAWWVQVIQACRDGRAILPVEAKAATHFATDSLHAASVLKASEFKPLAFNGRTFFLERTFCGQAAQQLLLKAELPEGATEPQWMVRVLYNFSKMLAVARDQSTIVSQTFSQQTLILTHDSTRKTRDKFQKLVR